MKPVLNETDHIYTDEFTGDNILGVSEILKLAGLTDLSGVPEHILETARNNGTNGHYACELSDKGILDYATLCDGLKPILERWKGFISDYGITFEPEDIERTVWSDLFDYAGKLDRVGMVGKKRILIDIKIVAKVMRSIRFQTIAYKIAWEERTGLKIDERWVVNLRHDGKAQITPYKKEDDAYDRKIFLSALNIAKEKLNGGK